MTCNVQGKQVTFDADAAICTAPLGVLKRSVLGYNDAFKFDPPLPDWKIKVSGILKYAIFDFSRRLMLWDMVV